jgi:hypothetical protein
VLTIAPAPWLWGAFNLKAADERASHTPACLTTRCQDHRMATGRDNARPRNYNPRIAFNIARLPELLGKAERE